MGLDGLRELVMDREVWRALVHGVTKSQTRLNDWNVLNYLKYYSGFCHKLTWISHGYTRVPNPEPPSHLPPHPSPQGHPSKPMLSTLSLASNLYWRSISHMIINLSQCYSLKSSHPCFLPQSPKVCSLHLYFFCCFVYSIIIIIFLNSTYVLIYYICVFLSDLLHLYNRLSRTDSNALFLIG